MESESRDPYQLSVFAFGIAHKGSALLSFVIACDLTLDYNKGQCHVKVKDERLHVHLCVCLARTARTYLYQAAMPPQQAT